jgi:hypothetical protein
MNRTVTARAIAVLAGMTLAVVSLTGCSNAPADLSASTASRLQTGVLAVSTQAAGGDYAAAQSALGAVQGDLLAAAAAGSVSSQRAAQIQAAINLVGADLSAAIEASKPTPTSEPAPVVTVEAPPPTDAGNSGNNGDQKSDKPGKGKDKPPKEEKPGKDEGTGGSGSGTAPTPTSSPTAPTTDGPSTPPNDAG